MKNGSGKTRVNYQGDMEKRIKVFSSSDPHDLEENVNIFLDKMSGKLHDVIFNIESNIEELEYVAILVYTPEKKDEKESE